MAGFSVKTSPLKWNIYMVYTTAFPILFYALEALRLNKTKLIKLEHPWSRAFMKIFDNFDESIVLQCQLFTGVLPLYHQYALRAMAFYYNLKVSSNIICREIFSLRGMTDVSERLVMYGNERPIADFFKRYRCIILNQFCAEVMK